MDKAIWSSVDSVNKVLEKDMAGHASLVEYNQQTSTLDSVHIGNTIEEALKSFKYGKRIISNKYFIIQRVWTYLFDEDGIYTLYIPIGQFPITPDHSMIYYLKLELNAETLPKVISTLKLTKYA